MTSERVSASEFVFIDPTQDANEPVAVRKFSNQWAVCEPLDRYDVNPSPRWWAIDQKAIFANPRDQPKWSIEKHAADSYIWGGRSFATFEEARQFVVDEIEKWARGPYGWRSQIKRIDRPYMQVIDLKEGDRVAAEMPDGSLFHGILRFLNDHGFEVADWQKLPADRPPVPTPSTTPPMWANDVGRSRRPKRRRGKERKKGNR